MQARRSSLYNRVGVERVNPIPQDYFTVWEPDSASNKVYIAKGGITNRHFSCGSHVTFQTSIHGTGKAFRFPSKVNAWNRYDIAWCTTSIHWTSAAAETTLIDLRTQDIGFIIENFILHGIYGEDIQCLFIKRSSVLAGAPIFWEIAISGVSGGVVVTSKFGGAVRSSRNFIPIGVEGQLSLSIDRDTTDAAFSFTPYEGSQIYEQVTHNLSTADLTGHAIPSVGGWCTKMGYPGSINTSNRAPSNCTIGSIYWYKRTLAQNEM